MTRSSPKPSPNGKSHRPSRPPKEANGYQSLTAREREVLGWISRGKRDAEIAQILGISRYTVSTHVQNILAKLGAETRTGACHVAMASGFTPEGGQ